MTEFNLNKRYDNEIKIIESFLEKKKIFRKKVEYHSFFDNDIFFSTYVIQTIEYEGCCGSLFILKEYLWGVSLQHSSVLREKALEKKWKKYSYRKINGQRTVVKTGQLRPSWKRFINKSLYKTKKRRNRIVIIDIIDS